MKIVLDQNQDAGDWGGICYSCTKATQKRSFGLTRKADFVAAPHEKNNKDPSKSMVLGVISSKCNVMPPHSMSINTQQYIEVLDTVVKP